MAFEQEPTRGPAGIGELIIVLKDSFDEEGQPYQSASFRIGVVMSDGSVVLRRGDLVPHITPAQRQGLLDFVANLRVQADTQIVQGG